MKYLFFVLFSLSTFAQTTLISSGNSWKYLDNGTDQGTSWRSVGFDDSSWNTGISEFGYGENDEATVVSFGPNSNNKYVTTYFRKTINLSNTFSSFMLKCKRDDGIVVYFNGNEVYRDGFSGTVAYNTLASNAADDGQTWISSTLAGNLLQIGQNTIAVEIHQTAVSSSDISFDFELAGVNSTYITRGPYLQIGTANSMQIRWRTNVATDSKINYGTNLENLNQQVTANTSTTEHIINLTGLAPHTKYYYNIANSSGVIQSSPQHFFYTSPTIGTEKKTKIWVTGDCGTGTTTQTNVKNAFQNYVGNNYIDLWLLLGDNAYSTGTDAEYQSKFFQPYQNDRIMKQTPIFPTPGNHDYYSTHQSRRDGAYYQNFSVPKNGEVGGLPSNSQSYYSYNYANIHFVSLDSYGTETGSNYRIWDTLSPQITWLKADLAANTQKWTILYWHHPPYTMGSHNSDSEIDLRTIRERIVPILERYKVDMVMCGHSHTYERSRVIKGHYGLENTFSPSIHNVSSSSGKYDGSPDSCPYTKNSNEPNKGILYVVSGSAGWSPSGQPSPHDAMYYTDVTNGGSLYLEIEENRLDAKFIADNGSIKDQFTMMKDVSKKRELTILPNLSPQTLTASWIGNYNWQVPSATNTRNISINPIIGNTYYVSDDRQCLRDTLIIKVNPSCQNTHQISTEIGNNLQLKFDASQDISASGILQNGTNIIYNAGKSVTLTAGFQTKSGSIFSAYIGGCANVNSKNIKLQPSD